jgi:hypothetical protein
MLRGLVSGVVGRVGRRFGVCFVSRDVNTTEVKM